MSDIKSSPVSPEQPRPSGFIRYLLIICALVAAGAALAGAFLQGPNPDPFSRTGLPERFLYPNEENAFKRFPAVSAHLSAVCALPPGDEVWAVGDGGVVLHSSDGGESWERQSIPETALRAVPAESPPTSSRPATGRRTPETVKPPQAPTILQINRPLREFIDFGPGRAWAEAPPPGKGPSPVDVRQQPPTVPGSSGPSAPMLKTPEAPRGLQVDPVLPEPVPAKTERGSGTGRTTVEKVAVKKAAAVAPPRRDRLPDLAAVFFLDGKKGWLVGSQGAILATDDGGKKWEYRSTGTSDSLTAVRYLPDGLRGWVLGKGGTVLVTVDGGRNWTPGGSLPPGPAWSALHVFRDGKRCVAAGSGGSFALSGDGGRTWSFRKGPGNETIRALRFLSGGDSPGQADGAEPGWAVGDNGIVLRGGDSGGRWEAARVDPPIDLSCVEMSADGRNGWAAGKAGTALFTRDGGGTWSKGESGTRADLRAGWLSPDGMRGFAVGSEGTIRSTFDGGRTWNPSAGGRHAGFTAGQILADGLRGVVVGGDGAILSTGDGGKSWRIARSGTHAHLHSVHFPGGGDLGWAVGTEGTVLSSGDGGKTWRLREPATNRTLYGVHFLPDGRGWTVGAAGVLLSTEDGGNRWAVRGKLTDAPLFDIRFHRDGKTGWAVGGGGILLRTIDGGAEWRTVKAGDGRSLYSVHFLDDGLTGWAAGEGGALLLSSDGGKTWTPGKSGTTASLRAVRFLPDGRRGWAVGDGGIVLASRDGGAGWTAKPDVSKSSLHALDVDKDGVKGWIFGRDGTILSTEDGGQSWKDRIVYRKRPAYWLLLAVIVAAGFVHASVKWKPTGPTKRTVADILVSDRPIEAGEADALDLGAIARGLSLFLRNRSTQPPLTISITGEWGTGKSSLINLLKADLQKRGVRPVWFNAWHHQKEEHLLAALLENIRAQAIPPLYHPAGASFRARLLWHRCRKRFVPALLVGALFMALSGYFASHPDRCDNLARFASTAVETALFAWKEEDPEKVRIIVGNGAATLSRNLPGAAAFLMFLVPFFFLVKAMKPFGISPASLLASMSKNFSVRDVSAQTSFRYWFSKDFKAVTEALRPRTMLILIDDLDRCAPENVLEVLEAINFLVSSGNCYVVIGMARDRVERCVGLGFKDVAKEMQDPSEKGYPGAAGKEGGEEQDKERRREFARHYLEKLINIEVPVPAANPAQSSSIIVSPEDRRRDEEMRRSFLPALNGVGMAAGIAALVFGSFYAGYLVPATQTPPPAAPGAAPAPVVSPAAVGAIRPPAAPARPGEEGFPPGLTGSFVPGQESDPPPAAAVAIFGLFAIGSLLAFRWPAAYNVTDSLKFEKALRIWHPLIYARHNTPRSMKRFLNRVRYFAMRLRSYGKEPSAWSRILSAVGVAKKSAEEAQDRPLDVPEEVLVALSAIHHADDSWLDDPAALAAGPTGAQWEPAAPPSAEGDPASPPTLETALREAIGRHRSTFPGSWPPTGSQIARFRKLYAGIRVN